jgi:hypothetical protein
MTKTIRKEILIPQPREQLPAEVAGLAADRN